MGRTACTEPQCLYKGALYLYLLATLGNECELCEFWNYRIFFIPLYVQL